MKKVIEVNTITQPLSFVQPFRGRAIIRADAILSLTQEVIACGVAGPIEVVRIIFAGPNNSGDWTSVFSTDSLDDLATRLVRALSEES